MVGGGVGGWWNLALGLRLDAGVGWFFWVALSGLSLSLDHGGHQMLGAK
jgi:hypothetical protein